MEKYDVVVIGGGIAGLSAGLTSAQKGHRTILIEQNDATGGKAAPVYKDGFTFDPGPSICIMKWVYEDLFSSTGADIDDYIIFDRLDPAFSLINENCRKIVLPANRRELVESIGSWSASDASGLEKLFDLGSSLYPIVKKTFFSRSFSSSRELLNKDLLAFVKYYVLINKYKVIIDRWFADPYIKAWLYSFPTYTGQTYNSIAVGALLIPYIIMTEGVYYPRGGINMIPAAVAKRAEEMGLRIMTNTKVTDIHREGTKIISIGLANGKTISAKAVISAIDRSLTEKMLGLQTQQSASYSYVSLQLGVSRKIKCLNHHTVCIPDTYEKYYEELYVKKVLPSDPVLYIHAPSVTNPECAPKGCESLFVVIPTYALGAKWQNVEGEYMDRILMLLNKYDISIRKKDIIYSKFRTPAYYEINHGNYLGSLFGPDESGRILGILPPGMKIRQIRNIALCGGGIGPGAGMPMVTISGQLAANHISSIL